MPEGAMRLPSRRNRAPRRYRSLRRGRRQRVVLMRRSYPAFAVSRSYDGRRHGRPTDSLRYRRKHTVKVENLVYGKSPDRMGRGQVLNP